MQVNRDIRALPPSPRRFVVSYEKLITDPFLVFDDMLTQFGIPRRSEDLKIAIDRASIKRAKEIAAGLQNSTSYRRSSLIPRNGSIGQWRQYFDAEALQHVRTRLHAHGISLTEFQLEPWATPQPETPRGIHGE